MNSIFTLNQYQIFLNNQPLFQPLSTQLSTGELLAITGASGSGKSTIMADISGVLAPVFNSQGQIHLNGRDLRPLPVEQRKVGILFQDDLLFPHLNVYENLVFGLPGKWSKTEKKERIHQVLQQATLADYQDRDIATLSGGQRARIALLRTLLSEPDLILLDEPFSKLDKALREQFRPWVYDQIRQLNIPAILVTHDHDDIPKGSQTLHLEIQHA
ncbi:ATP-binding cassette domain-containing protein [Reinekea sp. G2M2-21]|uniref:ATP-binding cassette domain-containing protein n=1 Tax=Reinekea sp. G2M2-21 TaxID=2788942 RepID=UPI001E4DE16D|nr:ATP-binding cassette domain-containing protein [Reinekea sp. G2M2-21]